VGREALVSHPIFAKLDQSCVDHIRERSGPHMEVEASIPLAYRTRPPDIPSAVGALHLDSVALARFPFQAGRRPSMTSKSASGFPEPESLAGGVGFVCRYH
jgi:hypothetical protein